MLALTLSMPFNVNTQSFVWIAIAVGLFLVLSKVFGVKTTTSELVGIATRATELLRYVDGLGAPALAPLLKAISERKWKELPSHFSTLLNTLQDKVPRKQFLDGIMYTQIDNRLANANEREELLKYLEAELKVTIPRSPQ